MRSPFLVMLIASIIPLSLSGIAQISGIRESEAVQTARGWRYLVTNTSSSSIVAFHATFRCTNETGFHYMDNIVTFDSLFAYGSDIDIPPGGSHPVYAPDPSHCPGKIDAVIFSDGRSEGDKQEVIGIYQRRRGAYKALADAIPLLDTIATDQATPQNVIDILRDHSGLIMKDMTLSADERTAAMHVFLTVISVLQSQHELRIPSDSTTHHGPNIDEIVKSNNTSRHQAHAIVLSRKLQEWRSDLDGKTELPNAK